MWWILGHKGLNPPDGAHKKLDHRREFYRMDLIQAWRPFLESPGNVSSPESCFMLVVQYNIKVSIIFENETKEKLPGPFEKRALGPFRQYLLFATQAKK